MEEQPAKRQKCDETPKDSATTMRTLNESENLDNDDCNSCSSNLSSILTEADKALQESNKRHIKPVIDESKLGIELFIGDTKDQFHGLVKSRYADFIVHEIDTDGNVAKLTDLEPPIEEEVINSLKLEDLFDRKVLVFLSNVNNGLLDSYKIDVTGMDKETRTSIHHAIRDSYDRLESSTSGYSNKTTTKDGNDGTVDNEDCDEGIKGHPQLLGKPEATKFILVTRRNKSSRHRSIWPRGRPDYTRFVLYKENKDTMDAIHNLAVATNTKPSIFTYAGTKDRRAITSQWITGWRIDPKRLIGAMRRFNKRPYLKVGNFSFQMEPIRLGQLKANRFALVIRHLVHNSKGQQVIENSMRSVKENGFVNYFGLQRFGTRTVQTYEIGLAILQSRWNKAVDLILSYRYDENSIQEDNVSSQDQDNNNGASKLLRPPETDGQKSVRQQGKYWARGAEQHNACIDLWKSKHDADLVFKKFPHFRITNEGLIIKALAKSSHDHSLAITSLPRNTRSMYVHSYQSLLWNKLATYRLQKHGYKVVTGDLILPPETNISNGSLDVLLTVVASDEFGEVLNDDLDKIHSTEKQQDAGEETAKSDIVDIHSKILTVTEDELDKYTIFDVVLPLPGSRVKIPQNDVGVEYERLLKEDGLNIESFRCREKIFVSYGSYRKIIVKPDNLTWNIKQYSNPRENLIDTDLDELDREMSKEKNSDIDQRSPPKSDSCDEALTMNFDLPPSSYATMCLRELMKKPSTDFNNRF